MKKYREDLQEFVDIYNYINDMENALLSHPDIDRERAFKLLYNKAFSNEINGRLQEIHPFDWVDPDMGYDDDYLTWKCELDDAVEEVKTMLGCSD